MSPSNDIRIGFVGSGFARRVQIPALAFVPGAKATAIASGHRANAEAVAREFGLQVFGDGTELARSADVDRPDRLAWIDHELRYEPNRRRARELMRSNAIGEVRHVELSLKPYLRGDGRPQASDAPWTWWSDDSRGGGILGAVGSHLIDLCRFWTGSEITYVAGLVETFVKQRKDESGTLRPVTADDFASCVLQTGSGAVATITLSTVAHHGPGHYGQVTGSEGTLVLSGETKLELGKPGGPLEDISAPDDLWEQTKPNNMWARSFVRLMREMVQVIRGSAPQSEPATFRDGWQVQRVLDAIRGGRGVQLD